MPSQNGTPLYLKQNVQVEPLVDRWYAWSHLIPPATAVRNITERHLKIMASYIAGPQVHANAVKNPQMLGGPFIDCDARRADEIKDLYNRTKSSRAALLELSAAISALDAMLQESAKGYSLEPLYKKIPQLLRGYVELVYDLNNQPGFRLIEPLLYRSRYFDKSMQGLTLSTISGDDRPFVLSTPRLPSDDIVELHLEFDAESIDQLFELKTRPQPWERIISMLPVDEKQLPLLRSFFATDPPTPYEPFTGKGVRWRYFGHACILIESNGTSILLDPALSYTYETKISRYTYADLPEHIDYVLITHNHQDHLLFETLLQIRHKVGHVIVPRNASGTLQDPSMKLILEHSGFDRVIELGELETECMKNGSITALPFLGEHGDLDIRTKLAYLVRLGRHSLLFAADSCNIEPILYDRLHDVVGDVSVLFLGMECDGAPMTWLYGPLITRRLERAMDQSRRFAGSDFRQALGIVDSMKCHEAYVYAMGQEPWFNHIMSLKYTERSRPIVESNLLIDACRGRGMCCERLFGEKQILMKE